MCVTARMRPSRSHEEQIVHDEAPISVGADLENTLPHSCHAFQVMTIILGAALVLQAVYMPYEYGHANWLEMLSLIVTVTTLYFSLYFVFALESTPLVVVTVLVILMNVATVAIFLYALIRAHWYCGAQRLALDCKV